MQGHLLLHLLHLLERLHLLDLLNWLLGVKRMQVLRHFIVGVNRWGLNVHLRQ